MFYDYISKTLVVHAFMILSSRRERPEKATRVPELTA